MRRRKLFTLAAAASAVLCLLVISSRLAARGVGRTIAYWEDAHRCDYTISIAGGDVVFERHYFGDGHTIEVPWWALATAMSVLPALWMLRRLRRASVARERGNAGLCPSCGYDLRATPGRCPECGRQGGKLIS
jgi:hypothetical protein